MSRKFATPHREILRRPVAKVRDTLNFYINKHCELLSSLTLSAGASTAPSDAPADALDVLKVFHDLLVVELDIGRAVKLMITKRVGVGEVSDEVILHSSGVSILDGLLNDGDVIHNQLGGNQQVVFSVSSGSGVGKDLM